MRNTAKWLSKNLPLVFSIDDKNSQLNKETKAKALVSTKSKKEISKRQVAMQHLFGLPFLRFIRMLAMLGK